MENTKHSAMSMKLIDVEKFISSNKIQEVTSPRILSSSRDVSDDSLFSYTLFGNIGSPERLKTFAYINLGKQFLHPIVVQLLKLDKTFSGILNGKAFDIVNNEFIIVDDTKDDARFKGLKDLYLNWDEFVASIKDTGTDSRKAMIKFLNKHTKEQVWQSKWLVLPAGLREINMMELENTGVINYDPINDLYIQLLNNSRSVSTSDEDDILGSLALDSVSTKIQNTLLEIHDFIMRGKLSGKSKFLRKNALKRTVMYSAGAVISMSGAPTEEYDSNTSANLKMGEIGVPITMLIDVFYPFVFHYTKAQMENLSNTSLRDFTLRELFPDKKLDEVSVQEMTEKFLDTAINDKYFLQKTVVEKKNMGGLFDYIVMDFIKNEIIMPILGNGKEPKKFVSVTRYPINNMKSTQFLFPLPYTTHNVKMFKLESGMEIEVTLDPANYSSSLVSHPTSLSSHGSDFDGKICWTL